MEFFAPIEWSLHLDRANGPGRTSQAETDLRRLLDSAVGDGIRLGVAIRADGIRWVSASTLGSRSESMREIETDIDIGCGTKFRECWTGEGA